MLFDINVSKGIGAGISIRFASAAPVTALVGQSGAGKTTTLNMIAGIVRPDRGRISIAGRTLFDSSGGVDLPAHQRRCGYVFQDDRLFPHLSVRRNLLYGFRLAPPDARWADFGDVVNLLGLEALLDRKPGTLSGGEARRVAIGRALLSGPDFLLMDEPLNSLDTDRREAMLGAIENIRDRYTIPILYVSHRPEEVARLAGSIVTIPARPPQQP